MQQPTSSNYPTLAKDRADRFQSMGALGKPAWQNHVQLRAMLRAKRGEAFANYLAKPSYDPDLGELRWTAEVPGVARRFDELSDEEQGKASLTLVEVRTGLASFVAELRAQGGGTSGGTGAFAQLLEQAMKVPSEDNLFFVGQQPVITFWGFQDQEGRSIDPTFRAPTFSAPGSLPASTGLGRHTLGAAGDPSPAPRKRPWWHWLLWALLALLLLLATLLLVRACSEEAGEVGDSPKGNTGRGSGASAAEGVDPTMYPGSSPEAGRVTVPGVIGAPGEVVYGGSVTGPNGSASVPGSDGLLSAPKDLALKQERSSDSENPASEAPPSHDQVKPPEPDLPKNPAMDAPKDPKAGQANELKQEPSGGPKNDSKGKTDPKAPALDPKGLKLPTDPNQAKKMGFLEGDWKAGENLADSKTKQPLDLGIKFGKDGKGEITLRRSDGSSCTGPVQGRMDGGRLSVEGNQSIPCSNGGNYAPPKIVCQPDSGGQSPCYGVNPDGSKYYMGMRRN